MSRNPDRATARVRLLLRCVGERSRLCPLSALRCPRRARGNPWPCLGTGRARRGVFRPGPGGSPARHRRTEPFFFLPCLLGWWRSPRRGPGRAAARFPVFCGSACVCWGWCSLTGLRGRGLPCWSSGVQDARSSRPGPRRCAPPCTSRHLPDYVRPRSSPRQPATSTTDS